MTASLPSLSASAAPQTPDMAWLPATPVSSLPCAIASLARLERADLRFEIADRTPEEIGALADRVEAALENACPAIGVENVLTGIEKLAARFGLEWAPAPVRLRHHPMKIVATRAALEDRGVAWMFAALQQAAGPAPTGPSRTKPARRTRKETPRPSTARRCRWCRRRYRRRAS